MKIKKILKETIVFIIVVFLITNIVGYYRTLNVKANKIATLKELKTINNISIKELINRKKILVLNFWGTWCPVCNQEVSTLSQLAKRDDITLITIAVNSGSDNDIKSYMQKKGISFIVINDNKGELAKIFYISVYPTTIFYSNNLMYSIKDSGYTTKAGFVSRIKYMELKSDK